MSSCGFGPFGSQVLIVNTISCPWKQAISSGSEYFSNIIDGDKYSKWNFI